MLEAIAESPVVRRKCRVSLCFSFSFHFRSHRRGIPRLYALFNADQWEIVSFDRVVDPLPIPQIGQFGEHSGKPSRDASVLLDRDVEPRGSAVYIVDLTTWVLEMLSSKCCHRMIRAYYPSLRMW